MKTELEEVIALTESAIAELKPAAATVPPKKTSPQPAREKWSKENHPAYQAGYRKTEPEPAAEEPPNPVAFTVNDKVSARWKSGDGSFYPARITAVTGSTSKPVYIVTFENYATTDMLSAKDIKPLSGDSKKRKADGMPGASSLPTPPSNPNVISAAANVDPALASQARQEPSKVSDGPPRPAKLPRKVKAGKELEAGKSKWQDFTTKGKIGKAAKRESMFRTPDGFNARGRLLTHSSRRTSAHHFMQWALQGRDNRCGRILRGLVTFTTKPMRKTLERPSEPLFCRSSSSFTSEPVFVWADANSPYYCCRMKFSPS